MNASFLSRFPYSELAIPAWQMGLYIAIISICMLTRRDKLFLIVTYIFTLYWAFFLYWGEVLQSAETFPIEATMYLMFAFLHVVLTLIAFLKEP